MGRGEGPQRVSVIDSPANPQLKELRRLSRRRVRRVEGRLVLEGMYLVTEALNAGAVLEKAFFSCTLAESDEGKAMLARLREAGVRSFLVRDALLNAAADTETPQGILAVARMGGADIEPVLGAPAPLVVVADRLQDPGNLGAIIRTADAAGADGVAVTPGTVDPYNSKVLRATMGSIFHLPVANVGPVREAIRAWRERGLQVVAAAARGGALPYGVDWRRGTALIVGNEARGLEPGILALTDVVVTVPMPGRAESLNVAAAAAILLYEAVRQRHYSTP